MSSMQHLLGAVALLAVLRRVTQASAVDRTLESGATGSAVVEAAIAKIRSTCIFGDDKLFLRRLAYLMTRDGQDLNAARNGGIWGIPAQHFNSTHQNNSHTINIKQKFDIDWNLVSYPDLQKPLYSALAAMLVVFNNRSRISRDVADQVKLWQDIFDSRGTKEMFMRTANLLDQGCYYKRKMDAVFLLDGSGSVSKTNFNKMTNFVQTIIHGYEVGANASRFGIVGFSTNTRTEVSLGDNLSKEQLLVKAKQIMHHRSLTSTWKGLVVLRNMFETQGRPDVPRVAFVMTDGKSSNMNWTLATAEKLKDQHVNVFTIGVGFLTKTAELEGIASSPSCTHVFYLNRFSELSAFRSELSKEACEAPLFLPPETAVSVNLLPTVAQKCNFEISDEEATVKISVDKGHVTYLLSSEEYPNKATYQQRIEVSTGQVKLLTNVTKGSGNPTRYCAIVGDSLEPTEARITILSGKHDACSQIPCTQPNTLCVPMEKGRQCQCAPGYIGANCQITISVADPKVSPDLPDASCIKIPLTPEGVTVTSSCKGAVYTSKDTCPTKDVHGTVTHVSEGSDSKVYVRPADQENAVYLMPEYPDGNCDNDTVQLGAPKILLPSGTDRHHLKERQFLIKISSLGATVQFTTDMGNATLYVSYDEFPNQDSFTWATSAQPGQDGALYFPRKQSRNTEEFVYCLVESPIGATIHISVQAGDAIRCRSSPCHNGATCIDQIGNYLCHCREGFVGTNCETNTVRILGNGISGVIEVFNWNFWGPVCHNSDWNYMTAKVACRQLQLSGGATGQHTERVGIFHDGFRCRGHEASIQQCAAISARNFQCNEVAVLHCQAPTEVRLVGGDGYAGRVEVKHNGTWGTICDDSWTENNARVICQMLSKAGGIAIRLDRTVFSPGKEQIWLDKVVCTGSENDIRYCKHNEWGTHNCEHSEDAAVLCADEDPCSREPCDNNGTCLVDGRGFQCKCPKGFAGARCKDNNTVQHLLDVQPVHGDSGLVLLTTSDRHFYGPDRHMTICSNRNSNDNSTIEESTLAEVVCRLLGENNGQAEVAQAGSREEDLVLDNMSCTGSELNLGLCKFNIRSSCPNDLRFAVSCGRPIGDTIGACASNPCRAPMTICKSFLNGGHLCGCPDGSHAINCDEAPFFADAGPGTRAQGPLYDSQTEYVRFIIRVPHEGSTVTLDCDSCSIFVSRKVYATESLYDSSYNIIRFVSPRDIFLPGENLTTWYFITVKIISSSISVPYPVAVVARGAPPMISLSMHSYAKTIIPVGPKGTHAIMMPPANGFVVMYSAASNIEMYLSARSFPTSSSFDWSASGRAGQVILSATQYPNANYIFFYFISQSPVTVTLSALATGIAENTGKLNNYEGL